LSAGKRDLLFVYASHRISLVDHLITLNKLNFRTSPWDRLSGPLVRLIADEVGPLVAAVLVLGVHLSLRVAVASCSEAGITSGK